MLPDYMESSWAYRRDLAAGLDPYSGCRTSWEGLDAELMELRDAAAVLAEVDVGESYEYDIRTVVATGETWWLVTTSGCSCPSPSETWSVEQKATRIEMTERILAAEAEEMAKPEGDYARRPFAQLAKALREAGHLPGLGQ